MNKYILISLLTCTSFFAFSQKGPIKVKAIKVDDKTDQILSRITIKMTKDENEYWHVDSQYKMWFDKSKATILLVPKGEAPTLGDGRKKFGNVTVSCTSCAPLGGCEPRYEPEGSGWYGCTPCADSSGPDDPGRCITKVSVKNVDANHFIEETDSRR